jgi:hypothetical protein
MQHLDGWGATTLLAIGLGVGLLDAVLTDPSTGGLLAECASVTEPNAREWLAGMVAAGYLTQNRGVCAASLLSWRTNASTC